MDENGKTWELLATLHGSRITRIMTCLKGEDRKGALAMALKVQAGLGRMDYGALLGALDPADRKIADGTDLIEQSILAMLHDIRLENPGKKEFKAAIEPYRERIEGIAATLARDRSLDIEIDKSLQHTYDRLVDYVSNIALRRQVLTVNPQFWRWLEERYPGIDRFLKLDEGHRMVKSNSLVKMLSVQFKHRGRGEDYMAHVNSICQRIVDLCSGKDAGKYACKASASYESAIAEMKAFLALRGEFGGVEIEKPIPQSGRNADLAFALGGETHFVEVYASRGFTAVGKLSKFGVDFREEWARLLRKNQVRDLAGANERTVFVLDVGRDYLPRLETRTPKFRGHVCAAMPETSEVIIIRGGGDVEAISVRGGQVVETTGLGKRLQAAVEGSWWPGAGPGGEPMAGDDGTTALPPMGAETVPCPHCASAARVSDSVMLAGAPDMCADGARVWLGRCESPECRRCVAWLEGGEGRGRSQVRRVVPPEPAAWMDGVPRGIADGHALARALLGHSPPASGALARGCLQEILRERFGATVTSLHDGIREVIGLGTLPQRLAVRLDRVSEAEGLESNPPQDWDAYMIVGMDRGVAELILEALEGLLWHCYAGRGEDRQVKRPGGSRAERPGHAARA